MNTRTNEHYENKFTKLVYFGLVEIKISGFTVNIYMYKTIQARVNTVAIPTTGKSCSLYRELLKPLWVIYQ